jgi:SAM-dependent methyltransferase
MIIAGGGTGATTAFIAEQLNHTNGEVVYIDFSMSSMKISQERTRIRKLQNIIWIQSWIEALIYLGIGSFDELQCSGVLHHLKIPSIGLKTLKDTLSKNGGMTLMVYAKYGRTAVYHIQHLMKMINADQHEIETEIKRAKITIDALPGHNWFIANQLMSDHFQGNIGIYDLFLHKRDIAFGFQTLFQWIQEGGLHFIDFHSIKKRLNLKIKYQHFDNILKTKTFMMAETKQLSITELLHGRIIKHDFYASKIKSCVADLHDASNVLYLYGNPYGFRQALANRRNMVVLKNQTVFFATMAEIYRLQTTFNYNDDLGTKYQSSDPITLNFRCNNFSEFLVNRLVDSTRGVNLKSLYQDYRRTINSNIRDNDLVSLTKDFYDSVKDTELFLLKKQYVNRFPKTAFLIFFVIK